MKTSEGRQLAEEEHRKQVERATVRDPGTYLQSVPTKKLYFETSAKTGDGVGEIFAFVQNTLLPELERETGGSRRGGGGGGGGRKKGMEKSITIGDGGGEREGPKCCK